MDKIVMLNVFFGWAVIRHILRAVMTFNVAHSMLKNKYNTAVTFFSLTISLLIFTYISFFFYKGDESDFAYEIICLILYYLLTFIVLLFATKGKLVAKLWTAFLAFAVCWISQSVPMIFVLFLGKTSTYSFTSAGLPLAMYMPFCVITFSFHFIFIVIIKLIKRKTSNGFNFSNRNILLLMFPVTHLLGALQMLSPFILLPYESENLITYATNTYITINCILSFMCLFIDFLLFFFADRFDNAERENIIKSQEIQKLKTDLDYTVMLKEEKQEFRKLKHDFSNLITTAMGFIEIGKYNKALSILKNTNINLTGLAGFSLCSNETVNTVLYIKKQEASKNHIEMRIEIDENCPVYIDDYDLCRLLHNVIDNGLNAVANLNTKREFYINLQINQDDIIIKTENKFNSKKSDKKGTKSGARGNGIKIAKEIAEKYNGKFSIKQSEDTWLVSVFLSNKYYSELN